MRLVSNETYISRRKVVGNYAGIASIVTLVASFFILSTDALDAFTKFVSLSIILTVGMLLSFVGGYYGERFGGPLAHYQAVRSALKGLDGRFTLFQYVLPTEHLVWGPDGLTVIVVRAQGGKIAYDGKWRHRQRGKFMRELAGQERIGQPEQDVARQISRMSDYLQKHLPDLEVPLRGVVLFTNPDAEIDVQDPPVAVFYGKKLKGWLRGPGQGKPVSGEVARALANHFATVGPPVESTEEDED
ncbi:MAG: NERD domain-containing protein [Anaerolineae bacterium]|nr:NERD domain-containing protein [Anaerolineae bacterium]